VILARRLLLMIQLAVALGFFRPFHRRLKIGSQRHIPDESLRVTGRQLINPL